MAAGERRAVEEFIDSITADGALGSERDTVAETSVGVGVSVEIMIDVGAGTGIEVVRV
jgi:hypothetical protein